MPDIVDLIRSDHQSILLLYQVLHDRRAGPCDDALPGWALSAAWSSLAWRIETHLAAAEEVCFVPMCGTTAPGLTLIQEAVAVHEDICEAIAQARLEPAGSPLWWQAVKDAFSSCVEHMDLVEGDMLPRFGRRAPRQVRDQLGRQWCSFVRAAWPG